MDNVIKDIRFSIRTLIKKPGVTLIATVTLALGICASTTIFSIVDAVVLKPLPFKDPNRIYSLFENQAGQDVTDGNVSQKGFLDLQQRNQVFDSMAGYLDWSFNITGYGTPEHVDGAKVSADFFNVLGVATEIGRGFEPGEDRQGNNHEVVISHAFWVEKFGADRGALGRTFNVDGAPATLIGVMPDSIKFPEKDTSIWAPIEINPQKPDDEYSIMRIVARLKHGVAPGQAQAQLLGVADQLTSENPKSYSGRTLTILPLKQVVVGDKRSAMLLLLAFVLFVLLIACANIANLQLARAASRMKEMAVRTALGASRGRIVRQLLTESLLLSSAGGLIGVLLSLWTVASLRKLIPDSIPGVNSIAIDQRVLLFALAASVLTGILFGGLPGLQASKIDVSGALKEEGRTVSGGKSRRLLSGIIAFEIATSLVLLTAAGLMIRSFEKLVHVNTGYQTDTVLALQSWLAETKYPDAQKHGEFATRVLERLAAIKGVESAGAAMISPLAGGDAGTQIMPQGAEATPKSELPRVSIDVVSSGYFKTLGITLLKGRDFSSADTKDSQKVGVISQSLADRAWPGQDAIGKRINSSDGEPWAIVVGVVQNVRPLNLRLDPAPEIYLPYSQAPFSFPVMNFFLRADGNPKVFVPAARDAIQSIDAEQPIFDISTMQERVDKSVATERFELLLLAGFAALSLILAAVGLYGVVDYSVGQRTHEIGVRMALGAQRGKVYGMVFGQTVKILAVGLACGLAGALALTRLMESMLFHVGATDPATLAGVSIILALVTMIATFIPSHRASRVDPLVALRYE
ncbi:MAG TPA: ABC transporter permease [Blastocatellia bacterium]|nr:ABC transporter permease [Blastocatellia bacterium]